MNPKSRKKTRDKAHSLKGLIDIKEWQKIQDNFSALTGVGLRTFDARNVLLTKPSGESRLCTDLLKKSPLRDKICGLCLPMCAGDTKSIDKNISTVCEAGLHNFIAPLKLGSRVVGYLAVGPIVLVARKPKLEYRKIAENLGLNPEEFWGAMSEIKLLSFTASQSLIELVRDVAEYTIRLSYENFTRMKEALLWGSPKLNKLLDDLLSVALQVSGANIGSIMVVDREKMELSIRTAKGIADEIVNTARVLVGRGISGTVAEEGRPYLIDDAIEDNRIKRYLERPSLNSSMVIPIKVDEKVVGVMNLGASSPSPVRFTTDNVQLISRLIDLSTFALHE